MLKVRDIMTRDVLTVGSATSLRDAAELFARHHVGGAPVVDGDALVGVVSMTDIIEFVVMPPNGVSAEPFTADARDDDGGWSHTGDDAEGAAGDDADEVAARFFAELWDDSGADVAEPFDDTAGAPWDRLAEHTVGEVMTRGPIAVTSDTPVPLAAARLRAADVHRALVVDGGALRGIVTTTDIVRAVADGALERRTFVFGPPRPSRLAPGTRPTGS